MPLFGFGFEALRTSNNSNGGTLSNTNSTEIQLKSVSVQGNNRTNVVHKQNGGLSNNSHTFSFNWTAPATNIGNVMFYTAGNAANNQNDSLGDYIYKTTQLVTPFVSGFEEQLNENGFVLFPNPAADFYMLTTAADNPIESLKLYDLNGKVVFQHQLNTPVKTVKINKPELPSGIYVAACQTRNGLKWFKIVFQ
ncbi:MAG: T9SS type A sorting domain-containing protein [Bacteroidia bacterium]|nr:T9SS type A sorting domain-containing protein [Bacteroidia bacterium]